MSKLTDLVDTGDIASTGAKPKLPTDIPNLTNEMLDVYRIPLKYLYYNNENGRIATQIKHDALNLTPHDDQVGTDYNDKISSYIIEDNIGALKKTKKSIRDKGQQIYGYVLEDGRIVDGNRRFTALRQLQDETGKTQFFEAVILPFNYDAKAERTQIKKLELSIQKGTEEKIPYDSVDDAVDVYQIIVEDELMTPKDYSLVANVSAIDVNKKILAVKLMHEFFKFVNMSSTSYYLIKDLQLYTPINELAQKLKKSYPKKGPKYEQTKDTAFAMFAKMILSGGDTVGESRDYFKTILKSGENDNFNDSVEDTIDDLRDVLDESEIKSTKDFTKRLEKATPELRELAKSYNKTANSLNRGKSIENFIADVKESLNTLTDMKKGDGLTGNLSFDGLTKDQISQIRETLIQIHLISDDLIEVYNNEQ